MAGLLDFIQGASNAAAGTVAGPVDLLSLGLRKVGVPLPAAPFGGSQWMQNVGLMREPENRTAGLLGESLGNVLPIVAAARGPQIAGGLLQMGENMRAPMPMNAATHGQGGAVYFRRTSGPNPDNGTGHMMFAKDKESIGHYGKTLHTFNDATPASAAVTVDASDRKFMADVMRALRSDEDVIAEYGRGAIKNLAREANPSSIVDSAGLWDNLDLTKKVWDRVLEPKGIYAVKTSDGAVVFDPSLVKTRGASKR